MAHLSDRWHRKDRTRTARYGKGLRWQVEWVDGAGAKRKRSFEHKALAEDFLTELRHEQKRGIYRAPVRDLSVGAMYAAWMAARPEAPATTVAANTAALRLFSPIAELDPAKVTRRQIQDVVNQLSDRYAPNTVRGAYGKLGSAFRWALVEGLIHVNPCAGVRIPAAPHKVIEPLAVTTVQEIAQTMRVPAVRAMVLFAAATGLRASELRAVRWEDIRDGQLFVHQQLAAKGTGFVPLKTPASRRRLTVGAGALAMLQELRAEHGAGERGEVFHHDGAPYAARSMSRAWELMRARSGLEVSGWHQLRHFHASQLIAAGFSPVAVARRLGHKNAIETLETYAHMWPADDLGMASTGDVTLPPPSDTS